MAYPTTLALITALWAPGPARTKSIAMWSAIGGGMSALGPLAVGLAARPGMVGFGLPADAAARRRRARARACSSCRPMSTSRPIGSTTSAGMLSALTVGGARARDQLRAGVRMRVPWRLGASSSARSSSGCSSSCGNARWPTRCTTSRSPSRRLFWVAAVRWHHRVRFAHGGHVHRPAVPAERARLLGARGRGGDPAGRRRAWSSPRRGRPSSSVRSAPATPCCSATSSVCWGSCRCSCSGTRGRTTSSSPWRTRWSASASASPGRPRRTRSRARCR